MIKGCHIKFTDNQFPLQLRPPQSIKFTDWESSLMDQDISTLLQKGVIEGANHSHGEFLSNVFLFTKLMKPCYAHLRCQGHIVSDYIDDTYLQQ